MLRGVFKSIGLSGTCITAVPLESTNSRTASLLLEECAQVWLELTRQPKLTAAQLGHTEHTAFG
jgi:hypothetical protein